MNHDVFISYSHKNMTAAQAICHELEDKGIKCWMAPRDIPVGAKYASVISKAIVHSRIVVLVFSDYSARSPWVESEINIAFSNRKTIIPYKIDKTNYEEFDEFYLMLNNRHWIEAYPDYKTRFKELVTIVAQTLGKEVAQNKSIEPASTLKVKTHSESKSAMAIVRIDTDLDCRVLLYGELIGVAKVGEYTKMTLPLGDNILKFVGLESDADCDEQFITIENYHQKLIKVKLLNKCNTRKAKEKAEQQRLEAECKAREDAQTKKRIYLLSSPDENFEPFKENGKYGVKHQSKIVIPLKYDFVSYFREGLAYVKLNGKYGFVDKTGNEVIPIRYDDVHPFSNGKAPVKLNGEWFSIDNPKSRSNTAWFKNIPNHLQKTRKLSFPDEEFEPFNKNGKYGVKHQSKIVIPLKYDFVSYFREGLAYVKLNGKYGFVDKTGNEVIPIRYDDVHPFSNGKAPVKFNKEWFCIDKNGNRVEE